MKNREPSHIPPVKRRGWCSNKRGPQHAGLPRIPVSRQPKPSTHGWWLHYQVVPGLRDLIYVESRSGENGCIFLSATKDRLLQKAARNGGYENPLEMLKTKWMEALGMEGRAAA
jgi:hypothetical protein